MIKKNKLFIYSTAGIFILALVVVIGLTILPAQIATNRVLSATISPSVSQALRDSYVYNGQNGKDALDILKQLTVVSQNNSGMITAINGQSASQKKHEYWAFYVNGKYASVGPAAYRTKNTDIIEWKLEQY